MDLSFQEKSAWGLLAGILLISAFYFPEALHAAGEPGSPMRLLGLSIAGVIALVVIEGVYHAIIAATGGDETDERDRLISMKAERNAGFALGFALFCIVGHIIAQSILSEGAEPEALRIAVLILAALTFSEVVKLACEIGYQRVGA